MIVVCDASVLINLCALANWIYISTPFGTALASD